MQLFVYYKFLEEEQADVKQRVQAMQAKLQQRFPQLLVQLMKRPKIDELGLVTWMETYDLSQIVFEDFKHELDRYSLELALPQPRRNEQFVNC
ncbi:MAG: hypothetical protein CK528_11200 [Alcaligenaceae bacterium]|nr:MAG: hypothetical protein CK528_11200 [Alcaligenaceae bacterium]